MRPVSFSLLPALASGLIPLLSLGFTPGCSASPDGTSSGTGAAANGGTDGGQSNGGGGDSASSGGNSGVTEERPNIVLIFADDLGYNDLSSYGSTTIDTPRLDQLAAEGQRWTDFYVASSVCSPSRAALLTGRLPPRSGLYGKGGAQAFFRDAKTGIPQDETTLAEALQDSGYATGLFGKWHLGNREEFLPGKHGFDTWYGVPYSHDIGQRLMRDDKDISESWNVAALTRRFTEEAIAFIDAHREKPFFLYLPYTAPHVPLEVAAPFAGKSGAGAYGDTVQEMDHYIGQVVDKLDEAGLTDRTLIIFTSDNGPWLAKGVDAGSADPFLHGKFTTGEGGFRVPAIFRWTGKIPAGQEVSELGTTTDLFTSLIALAGAQLPSDRVIDGQDLTPALLGTGASPREFVPYYYEDRLDAYRRGQYKISMTPDKSWFWLWDLEADPRESGDGVRSQHANVADQLFQEAMEFDNSIPDTPSIIGAQ